MNEPKSYKKDSITVSFMVDQLSTVVSIPITAVNEGDGSRLVTDNNLHRPGLALAGWVDLFTHERVQILGNTENRYLKHLNEESRVEAFRKLVSFPIPCIILTEDNRLDDNLVVMAQEKNVPVYSTPFPSTQFMAVLGDFLEDQFAPQQTLHGSLVDVYGIGLLLSGQAGIGKSEVALDLVERGHRLVADDVVMGTLKGANLIMGSGTNLVQHCMEIRGLGIVDIRAMFGVRAIRFQKRIEVVVNLHVWDPDEEYTRLEMVDDQTTILGVNIPTVRLPIVPGKNITVICEVIAMNYLLQHYGYDARKILSDRLTKRIKEKAAGASTGIRRGIEYFEHDTE